MNQRLLLVLALVTSCVNTVADEDQPFDTRDNVDVRGLYDCAPDSDTGYRDGNSFSIEVVRVDGKPVETRTANAYLAMQAAAQAAGVHVRIVSGFRTNAEQQYLYNCYVNCNCNSCNLAAPPGTSNHQSGHALDLNTSDAGVYSWLSNHGDEFGFSRTVPSEAWHWEWWGNDDDYTGPCGCVPQAETCNGADDDCDGAVDDEDACLPRDEAVFGATQLDAPGVADIDGDGQADVCARAIAGVVCSLSGDGAPFTVPVATTVMADANGWAQEDNFATLRLADVTGDGLADLCARANAGIVCFPSTGTGFGPAFDGPAFSDDLGWSRPEYYGTIRVLDVDGDGMADVCARAAAGFRCSLSTGTGFAPAIAGAFFSNDEGFAAPDKYGSIRMADIDGDGMLDACARASTGVECHRFLGDTWGPAIAGPAWSDVQGFTHVKHWSTLRFADLDGDGMHDVCVRAADGMHCSLSTGTGFTGAVRGPLSDENGWNGKDNYPTIRLADVTGDGRADLCARANALAVCFPFDGETFGAIINGPEFFADAGGFTSPEGFRTFRAADVDGDGLADLCGRDTAGFSCFLATGTGFDARIDGPRWADAVGWKQMKHAGTVMLSGLTPPPVVVTPEDPTDPSDPTDEDPKAPSDPTDTGEGSQRAERMDELPSSVTGCATTSPSGLAWVALALVLVRRLRRR